MDDILAQLRLQRHKQREAAAVPPLANAADAVGATEGSREGASSDTSHPSLWYTKNTKQRRRRHGSTTKRNEAKSMGNFIWDPVLKKYFPKSAFNPNGNNDVCIQRVQQASNAKSREQTDTESRVDKAQHGQQIGAIKGWELQRVVYRGTSLKLYSSNHDQIGGDSHSVSKQKKRKKRYNTKAHGGHTESNRRDNINNSWAPTCSERSVLLLTASLSYCTSTSRRMTIVSILSPTCIARRADVVPTVTTKDSLQRRCVRSSKGCELSDAAKIRHDRGCAQKKTQPQPSMKNNHNHATTIPNWFSMLHPIVPPLRLQL